MSTQTLSLSFIYKKKLLVVPFKVAQFEVEIYCEIVSPDDREKKNEKIEIKSAHNNK